MVEFEILAAAISIGSMLALILLPLQIRGAEFRVWPSRITLNGVVAALSTILSECYAEV